MDKIRSGTHSMNPVSKDLNFLKMDYHSLNIQLIKTEWMEKAETTCEPKRLINRLRMYKNFKPVRNEAGKIVKPAPFQGWNPSGTSARVEPNKKWFGK